MSLLEIYQCCNHTELYQLCRDLGLNVPPEADRQQLMAFHMMGAPKGTVNTLDGWRNGIAGFVLDHWKVLQNQIMCPLRSKDPKSCFGCLDTQVVACVVSNPTNEHNIERYRK